MNPIRKLPSAFLAAAMAGFVLSSASAGVVFSESFEAPFVSGFAKNTVPSGGKWIGATLGFGSDNRGLFNETVAWPATPPFTTPYGAQAYLLNYTNSGLTTSAGATGQTLTAGVTYKVGFNACVTAGTASGSYLVELVAFAAADNDAARTNCQSTRVGTVLASATSTVTTTNMSSAASIVFTPAAGNAHLGKDLGIRLIKGNNSVLYDNIRLIVGHDMNPSPASGVTIAGGNVPLSWANMPPTTGTDVYVDVWFGTNPAALTRVVNGGLNTNSTVATAPGANTYYWRVDSYLNGSPTGTPVTGDLFVFYVTDTDLDGLPDSYELANTTPSSATALNPSADNDTDGLTNLQEYQYGTGPNDSDSDNDTLFDGPEINGTVGSRPATNPLLADTDADGLSDSVESNTGTNPVDADWDNDGLKDGIEKKTGVFVSRTTDTGTDPYLADSDNDGAGDWYEVAATFTNPNSAAATSPIPYPLPDPDGSTGALNKPVKVYIMSGQSNMVGIGYVNGTAPGSLETIAKRENKFPNLVTAGNAWTTRNDVIYKGVITATAAGPLTAGQGADSTRVGPELGFGQVMGWYHDEPVLLLKASEGNRSLGWDFAPPATTRFNLNGFTYAAYGETPDKWATGSTPVPVNWYAGLQYDMCFRNEANWAPAGTAFGTVTNAYDVLKNGVLQNLPTTGNNLNGRTYEIAGFVWWQGHKDQYDSGHYTRYEQNLANLINTLRADFNAPNAPFVVGTIGFNGGNYALNSPYDYIYKAQKAISDPAKHPAFVGTVKSVDTTGYWRQLSESPGTQDFHYNNNAETYMLVGDAIGRAMIELQVDVSPPSPSPMTFAIAPAGSGSGSVGMVATTASDSSGPVEYWFENTTNGNNSGWIIATTWTNTGLTNGADYNFRVKARDAKGNETGWSTAAAATAGPDVSAPLPNPMTFASAPAATGTTTITMTATTASDFSGGVQYYFDCTVGGAADSGWQASPVFTATGLSPSSTYTYVVRAKDLAGNTTADSSPSPATTAAPNIIPVIANPNFDPPAEVTSDNPSPGYGLISSWTRSGTTSGVNPSSLPFLSPQSAPSGTYVAFIQGSGNLSQSLTGFDPSKLYSVTYFVSERGYSTTPVTSTSVSLNGGTTFYAQPDNIRKTDKFRRIVSGPLAVSGDLSILRIAATGVTGDNTLLIDTVGISRAVPRVPDGGFENPVQPGTGASGYELGNGGGSGTLTGSLWNFGATLNGIARNASSYTPTAADYAPEGSQTAMLLGAGEFSTTVGGFEAGVTYTLSFAAKGRGSLGPNTVRVQVGGQILEFSAMNSVTPGTSAWATYTSGPFTTAGGNLSLQFIGLTPGDMTTFIDDVRFNFVAEAVTNTPTFASYVSNPGFGIAPNKQGFNDDPDGDNLANGLEAWFGTHPGEYSAGIAGVTKNGNTITFTHPHNEAQPSDVTGYYQWSPNLVDWYAGNGVAGPNGGPTLTITSNTTGATTTVTATLSGSPARIFLRAGAMQN